MPRGARPGRQLEQPAPASGSDARLLVSRSVSRHDRVPGPADRYLPMLDLDVDEVATTLNLNELAATEASSGAVSNEASNEAVKS
jgi:hypothetical protein